MKLKHHASCLGQWRLFRDHRTSLPLNHHCLRSFQVSLCFYLPPLTHTLQLFNLEEVEHCRHQCHFQCQLGPGPALSRVQLICQCQRMPWVFGTHHKPSGEDFRSCMSRRRTPRALCLAYSAPRCNGHRFH